MLNFLKKKHGKIQKNSRSIGESTTLAAAAAPLIGLHLYLHSYR
jgi:hypothetical protein